MANWSNWSGSVTATPREIARPKGLSELSQIVARAAKVRVVGAGHSFMPLCETDGVLLQLDALEGELTVNSDKTRAWAPAGWSLAKLTEALWRQGASLLNQGDVNPQSLAGAISTGTHGTGVSLGSLATTARAFEIVSADGAVVTCSAQERPDLFAAARLSLGLLGVVTRIEIDVAPAYCLEERIQSMPLDEVSERWGDLIADNRHAEFFVFPYGKNAILKTLHPAESEGELKKMTDMDERAFRRVCDLCAALPFLTPLLQPHIVGEGVRQRRVGPAYQIFPSERTVLFEEMEYELPRANGWPALREAIAWIRKKSLPVTFPFEFRTVAADDIWLSPFNRGPGASISMHQYARMAWREIFGEAEKIFRGFDGRPHWAKRHTLTNADVHALYPDAARFCAVRDEVDPEGKFANAHLSSLFAVRAQGRSL